MKKAWPILKWVLVVLAGLVIWNLARNANALILMPLGKETLQSIATWLPAIVGISGVLVTLIGFHLLYRWVGNGIEDLGVKLENWRADSWIGLGVGVAMGLLTFLEIAMKDVWGTGTLEAAQTNTPAQLISMIILGILFGGIAEEVFFRGHLIHSIRNMLGNHTWSTVIAVAISVVLFGIGHKYQGTSGMIATGISAVVFTGLYLWRKRLTASIVAHAINDVVALLIVYFMYPVR